MVTLGGGSGWGVLLDDRQLPTLGTRWGQAVKRACPHPSPKVETAPADEENTPSNRPVWQVKKRRANTRNTLACNTRNPVDWGPQTQGNANRIPDPIRSTTCPAGNTRTDCGYYRYSVTVDHLPR